MADKALIKKIEEKVASLRVALKTAGDLKIEIQRLNTLLLEEYYNVEKGSILLDCNSVEYRYVSFNPPTNRLEAICNFTPIASVNKKLKSGEFSTHVSSLYYWSVK